MRRRAAGRSRRWTERRLIAKFLVFERYITGAETDEVAGKGTIVNVTSVTDMQTMKKATLLRQRESRDQPIDQQIRADLFDRNIRCDAIAPCSR